MARFSDSKHDMPFGTVIASRIIGVDESADKYLVELGTPQQFEDDESWYCPYRITGPNFESSSRIVGGDSVQALYLALNVIGSELLVLNRELGGKLRWSDTDLGFPVPATLLKLE